MSGNFECKVCHASFIRESAFMKHKCKQMLRNEELQTAIGQTAYALYSSWMKAYNRLVPDIEVFARSKFYKSFIKFANHAKQLKLADMHEFINLMKERDISPTIWTNDQVYALYIEYLDRKATPYKQAEITVNMLFKLSDELEVPLDKVFSQLHPNQILQYIRERKFSPWILLQSVKFGAVVELMSIEQRQLFKELIRPEYWKLKFYRHPDIVAHMKDYVAELGI